MYFPWILPCATSLCSGFSWESLKRKVGTCFTMLEVTCSVLVLDILYWDIMPNGLDFELVNANTRSPDHHTKLILKEAKGWHVSHHAAGRMFCFSFKYYNWHTRPQERSTDHHKKNWLRKVGTCPTMLEVRFSFSPIDIWLTHKAKRLGLETPERRPDHHKKKQILKEEKGWHVSHHAGGQV